MKKIKIIISCLITVCFTICLLYYLTGLLERKDSNYKYDDFFAQEEDFDVLFMGSSHVINGFFPMELWNDYGIVSYNFGGHSNRIPTSYWVMENALDYTTPQIMVIDCFLYGEYKESTDFSYMHLSFDAFPLSVNKVKAVMDLTNDPARDEAIAEGIISESERGTKSELLWDYSLYHTKWNEISQIDFDYGMNLQKGAEFGIHVTPYDHPLAIDKDVKIEGELTSISYLERMIEECESRNIEVLLVYIPFGSMNEDAQMEANRIYDVAEKYNVHYINFFDEEIINYQTDCYDEGHLNPSGARKITKYLGEYISGNYILEDQRENILYEDWFDDYENYVDLKNENLVNESDIDQYLMLLSGDNVDAVFDVRNKDIYKNQLVLDLFGNLGVNVEELTENTDYIIIKNGGEAVQTIDNFRNNGASVDTDIGTAQLFYDTTGENHDGTMGYYGLYIDGEEYLVGNIEDDTGLQITVKRNGELIDSVKFVYSVDAETNVNVSAVNR